MTDATTKTREQLLEENAELRQRLGESEATVDALRNGEVDAFVMSPTPGEAAGYTLEAADRPYRSLVEAMQQGTATVNRAGTVLYCNPYFARLLEVPQGRVPGTPLESFVAEADRPALAQMLEATATQPSVRG